MKAPANSGYPLLFSNGSRTGLISSIVTIAVIGASAAFYLWYSRAGNDPSPDSIAGYSFAFLGTTFMLLAAVRYSMYRRSRKREVGMLNASLRWHISLGIIALFLLFLHSFGNFNPRTGTYALYGMIAMVISGFVGRFLDRLLPRRIAREAGKALTAQGEDRMESITEELHSMVAHNTQELRSFKLNEPQPATLQQRATYTVPGKKPGGQVLQTSWDLAYLSLEETPQEVSRDTAQYRFVPDRKSQFSRPGALMPGAQERVYELQIVEQALRREQFYRYVIRYWRMLHVGLALLTIGLTLWHIEFALQLLIPVWLHH